MLFARQIALLTRKKAFYLPHLLLIIFFLTLFCPIFSLAADSLELVVIVNSLLNPMSLYVSKVKGKEQPRRVPHVFQGKGTA